MHILGSNLISWQLATKKLETQGNGKQAQAYLSSNFFSLLKLFGESYEQLFGVSMVERQSTSTAQSTFKTYEDLLFFTLYSIKSGLTYDLLGLTFGLDGANAYQNQIRGLWVLHVVLERGGHMPKRTYQSVEDFKEHWIEESEILIDATEQRTQRPSHDKEQKQTILAKKSAYAKVLNISH